MLVCFLVFVVVVGVVLINLMTYLFVSCFFFFFCYTMNSYCSAENSLNLSNIFCLFRTER